MSGLLREPNGLCLVLVRLTTLFNLGASVSSYHSIPRTIYNYRDICSILEISLIAPCEGINFVVASWRKTWKGARRKFCRAILGSAYSYPSCLASAFDSDENPSPSSRHENGALRSSGTARAAGNEGLRRNAASSP